MPASLQYQKEHPVIFLPNSAAPRNLGQAHLQPTLLPSDERCKGLRKGFISALKHVCYPITHRLRNRSPLAEQPEFHPLLLMTSPGILFMPHGNLQYSQLPIEKRAWVSRQSYGNILRIVKELQTPIAFEASGETLEIVAEQTPDVMDLLTGLMADGLVEPVASPQTHIMLANIDPEIGYDSLVNGLDTWERLTGARPVTGWNPECSWASFIPEIFHAAGFKILIADADSFLLSAFPGIREQTGLHFDVRGHSNKNQLFRIEEAIRSNQQALETLYRPNRLQNGLTAILRSDMMCNIMLWYLMGATEGNREVPIQASEVKETLRRWKNYIPQGDGFIMPYAEDAEYVGTTAYFFVKQFGLARFFEEAPESISRFAEILGMARDLGFDLLTPAMAVSRFRAVEDRGFDCIENGCAWHGGTAKAWANTPYSRILDPLCQSLHQGLRNIASAINLGDWRSDAHFSVMSLK